MVAETPFCWRPRMYWAASFPVRRGSSENDSKFRPPKGCRCMQTVGASNTLADLALVSSARCCPTSYKRSLFQVEAKEMPQGKSAACYERRQLVNCISLYFLFGQTNLCSTNKNTTPCSIRAIAGFDSGNLLFRDRLGPPEVCSRKKGHLFFLSQCGQLLSCYQSGITGCTAISVRATRRRKLCCWSRIGISAVYWRVAGCLISFSLPDNAIEWFVGRSHVEYCERKTV